METTLKVSLITNMKKINWSEPNIGKEEKEAVLRVLASGWLSQGSETKSFEKELGAFVGNRFCVVVNNGTSALIASLLAHNIKPGDEVIVPAHTFIAPINAILSIGATPVLADVDIMTWNTTPSFVERKITPKTKAILPVNVAGLPVDIFGFQELAKKYNLSLIIDSAESFGGEYKHRLLGDIHFEHTSIFSFHTAKQLTTIEGGCIFTDNKEIYEKCRSIRDQGMQGRYNYTNLGFNFRITDLQSAIGRVQLQKVPKALIHRNQCVTLYKKYLKVDCISYQTIPEYVTKHPHLFFGVLFKDRNNIIKRLSVEGVDTRICWPYILDQPYHKRLFNGVYPNSKNISSKIVTLPLSNIISFDDVKQVCDVINSGVVL